MSTNEKRKPTDADLRRFFAEAVKRVADAPEDKREDVIKREAALLEELAAPLDD